MFAGLIHVKDYFKNYTESRKEHSRKSASWGIFCDSIHVQKMVTLLYFVHFSPHEIHTRVSK